MRTSVFLLLTFGTAALECAAQSIIVPYNFTTIAGQPASDFPTGYEYGESGGFANGADGAARFNYPEGLAVDGSGDIFVADTYNNVIREMTQVNSVWVVTTVAGQPGVSGYADSSTAGAALFNQPRGVAVDSSGNVYIADTGNNLIRLLTPSGVVSTIAGDTATTTTGGYYDGPGLTAQFDSPEGLAVDIFGNLYVGDYNNNVIRKVTKGSLGGSWQVYTLAGGGTAGSPFSGPVGVAVDGAGNVYVADSGYNRIDIVTPAGAVSTLAGSPPTTDQLFGFYDGIAYSDQDGVGQNAGFSFPEGVAVDASGNVYVADTLDSEIRKISPQGSVTTVGGEASFDESTGGTPVPQPTYEDGAGSDALFFSPIGVAVDGQGNIYVADTWNCVIRKGVPPAVQVVAMEVTQVIQDWNNSIPLIEGKDTYVRAHLQLPSTSSSPVMVSSAVLYGTGSDGSALPGSPINPLNSGGSLNVQTANASNTIVREDFTRSLNFRLPPEWLTGSISLRLSWPGILQPINVVPNNSTVQVNFVPAGVPQLEFFPVGWTDGTGTLHSVDQNVFNSLPNRVLSCFPAASLAATFGPVLTPAYTGSQPTDWAVETLLKRRRSAENPGGNKIYHGVLPVPANSSQPWTGDTPQIPGPISYSMMLGSAAYGSGRQTVSHELGHNLGLYHDVSAALFGTQSVGNGQSVANGAATPPEVGPVAYVYPLFQPFDGYPHGAPTLGPMTSGDNSLIYGLDSFTLNLANAVSPVLSSTNSDISDQNYYFDLMSYCVPNGPDQEDCWPSSVTYASLLQSINNTFPPVTPTTPRPFGGRPIPKTSHPRPKGGADTYLMVQGTMDFNAGTAQFLPGLPVTTTNTPPTEAAGTNFLLQALDNTGAVLQSAQFTLQPNIFAENVTNQVASFIVFLTENPSMHTLVLSYNGRELATLTASPNPPALTLTTPNGGQSFGSGPVNIAWTGSDADGNTLAYTVEYSADDGTTWKPLALDLPGQSLALDSSYLAASTEGLIRVIASDGFNTTIAQSAATFTVQPHAPTVTINTPMNGSIFMGDQQLFLDASVNDLQDGALNGTNVQWYSDRDGALGAGAIVNFDATILSEGNHTITVTATDSAGLTNSAETQVLVLHYPPPQLGFEVISDIPGYTPYGTLTWPSYYTNYALQNSSSVMSGWSTVTNNPPQVVGNQQTVYVGVSNNTSFYRLILQP